MSSLGMDRETGMSLTGWSHVMQSVADILTVRVGEQFLRRWYGSPAVRLLGELGNQRNIVRFFNVVKIAIDLWEPRYRIRRIIPLSLDRAGTFAFQIEGTYYPRGHLGDFTPAGVRRVTISADGGSFNVE
jgi:phage baseplate assembly protein W